MTSNICGNCSAFSPGEGQKFFNCTVARHAGLGYGMQVRADSRACDRFSALSRSPEVVPGPQVQRPKTAEPPGLCTLGQRSLVLAVAFSILLVTWLLYTCATV